MPDLVLPAVRRAVLGGPGHHRSQEAAAADDEPELLAGMKDLPNGQEVFLSVIPK